MPDFLSQVCSAVRASLAKGYYDYAEVSAGAGKRVDLKSSASTKPIALIAELKPKSPSAGRLRTGVDAQLAQKLEEAGACAISVLVEPSYFGGSIATLASVSSAVEVPVVFKDFVVSKKQVEAAANAGASIILLIAELFDAGLCDCDAAEMVSYAHTLGLGVLFEAHDSNLLRIAKEAGADYFGVNNRDLRTLDLDVNHFSRVCAAFPQEDFVVAESGYSTREQLTRDHKLGADAFLIGASIMASDEPAAKVRELVFGD